ncbi:MAG: methylmalonyl Co-A mutase-associated GTPase MeaB [Bacteroidetes bacterium]|nr:methylmalonyl Co-A mutase-associated GTPase MeaB [Bacteroidota bacterium]
MKIDDNFLERVFSGDKRAIARAISIVEDETEGRDEILRRIYSRTGNAYKIGITGPPGAGKSTLTNALVKLLVSKGYKVGVIAIDPTSPFTGGALLGDRIRMNDIGMLDGVYIRSMATRGSLGGLSMNVVEACDVLDASGKDFILIETVGVGQSELDIAKTADTTIVVLVPESGDAIQAMKAGLMEIADIFVLNKSDREGADGVAATLKNIIHLKPPTEDNWIINVLKTIGSQNKGIEELLAEVDKHKAHLEESGYLKKKRIANLTKKIYELVHNKLNFTFWDSAKKRSLDENLNEIYEKRKDPYSYVESIM